MMYGFMKLLTARYREAARELAHHDPLLVAGRR